MKRVVLFCMVIVSMSLRAQTNLPILYIGDRLPYLYYWDTNWYDVIEGVENGPYNGLHTEVSWLYDAYRGRPCVTAKPMKVIGIAAPAFFNVDTLWYNVQYTSVEDRLPEYFQLYQMEGDSIYFRAEARWDTVTPNYRMQIAAQAQVLGAIDDYFNLYEAYFETPVIVHDTFVVGGTTHNNLRYGYFWNQEPGVPFYFFIHLPTFYPTPETLHDSPHKPSPLFHVARFFHPIMYQYPWPNDPWPQVDTTKFYRYRYSPALSQYQDRAFDYDVYWLPFFAIFDTNFDYEACMGVSTTGLRVEWLDSVGVGLAWDDSGVEEWQVELKSVGTEEGLLSNTPINYIELEDLLSNTWYQVRVRTYCDSVTLGDWSDTVMFYFAGDYDTCGVATGLHVLATDSASVWLSWDAGSAMAWQVEIGMCDLGINSGQTTATTAPALSVMDLPYVNAWYWARVRSVCDTDFWSDWTDTVHFYVPNHYTGGGPGNPNDTTQTISPVEQYTYLMPNPARDEVSVVSSFRVKEVELYGTDGKLLRRREANAIGVTFPLEGLPAGVYFVRVRTAAGVTTKRLIIE